MEDADGVVALVEEDEEAGADGDDPVSGEVTDADAEAAAGGGLEEGDLAGVVRAHGVAVAERDPAARGEVVVGAEEWGVRAGAPVGAGGAEADVVHHVAGDQHPLGHEADYVAGERRPASDLLGGNPPALATLIHALLMPSQLNSLGRRRRKKGSRIRHAVLLKLRRRRRRVRTGVGARRRIVDALRVWSWASGADRLARRG